MIKPCYTLIDKDGTLYLPLPDGSWGHPDTMLLYFYPAGDCDTVCWPRRQYEGNTRTWENILAGCIFDEVETGTIPDKHGKFVIVLPDGTEFDYQVHVL